MPARRHGASTSMPSSPADSVLTWPNMRHDIDRRGIDIFGRADLNQPTGALNNFRSAMRNASAASWVTISPAPVRLSILMVRSRIWSRSCWSRLENGSSMSNSAGPAPARGPARPLLFAARQRMRKTVFKIRHGNLRQQIPRQCKPLFLARCRMPKQVFSSTLKCGNNA